MTWHPFIADSSSGYWTGFWSALFTFLGLLVAQVVVLVRTARQHKYMADKGSQERHDREIVELKVEMKDLRKELRNVHQAHLDCEKDRAALWERLEVYTEFKLPPKRDE